MAAELQKQQRDDFNMLTWIIADFTQRCSEITALNWATEQARLQITYYSRVHSNLL
jgi:hypothetical protein